VLQFSRDGAKAWLFQLSLACALLGLRGTCLYCGGPIHPMTGNLALPTEDGNRGDRRAAVQFGRRRGGVKEKRLATLVYPRFWVYIVAHEKRPLLRRQLGRVAAVCCR
jgi:hypothetical protein